MLPFSQDFTNSYRAGCRREQHQVQVPAKNGYSKASVQWFLDDRPYGKPHVSQQQTSHFYQGRCPTFLRPACLQSGVSRFPIPSLSTNGDLHWPTTGSVFIPVKSSETEAVWVSSATQQRDASFKWATPLSAAGFYGCQQAFSQRCMHSLLWPLHRTPEAACSISQSSTAFSSMDFLLSS